MQVQVLGLLYAFSDMLITGCTVLLCNSTGQIR